MMQEPLNYAPDPTPPVPAGSHYMIAPTCAGARQAVATPEGCTFGADQQIVFPRRDNEPKEQADSLTYPMSIHAGDTIGVGEQYCLT